MNEFKLIVAGGRDYKHYLKAKEEIEKLGNGELKDFQVSIVCGMAGGGDAMGKMFAELNKVQLHPFPADWNTHGKAAGFLRNRQMGDFADGLLAFWDGQSRGTAHMIQYMRSLGKSVRVVMYKAEPSTDSHGMFYTKYTYPQEIVKAVSTDTPGIQRNPFSE